MKVLLILAHPEPRSLNASLYNLIHVELEQQGHEIQTSDLYRMQWKPQADRDDFGDLRGRTDTRLKVTQASFSSYASGTLTEDVKKEQSKLVWADFVILIFPIWWFSFPAILKGWVDRVFAKNFAYGTGDKSGTTINGSRLEGKRGMVVTTVGGKTPSYSARGIHGPIDDVLFPINHGVLHFTGFEVLPPIVVYDADNVDDARFDHLVTEIRARVCTLDSTAPIPFRTSRGGDYLPDLTLRDGVEREVLVLHYIALCNQSKKIHISPCLSQV
ncbi:flavoprotein-like protein [Paraphoma chrysanthemicola]|nr:flavoprotein-like protein [Paraphoma chrysanthemicola]